MITTTFTALRKAGACTEGYRKLAKYLGGIKSYGAKTPISVSVVLESNGLDDALWVLHYAALEDVQPLMLTWACDCAERVLTIWEAKYPNDKRPHEAITSARNWAANPCEETQQASSYAADAAARAARAVRAASYAADAAAYAADAAAYTAACAADAAAYTAAYTAACAAACAADAAERDWQINRLKELLG